jgi:hypothetical protein
LGVVVDGVSNFPVPIDGLDTNTFIELVNVEGSTVSVDRDGDGYLVRGTEDGGSAFSLHVGTAGGKSLAVVDSPFEGFGTFLQTADTSVTTGDLVLIA